MPLCSTTNRTSLMAETTVTVTVVVIIIVLLLAGDSSARELRPSDHGLIFQTLPPTGSKSSPEMRSFFNSENSSPTTSSSDVALPRAMDSGSSAAPPSWLNAAAVSAGPNRGEHVGKALMAASVVCGIAGAVLLVASGLLYLLKYRTKHDKQNAAFGGGEDGNVDDENDDNNKLQLVVRNP